MLISSLFNSMEQWLEYLDIQMYCHFKCRIMSETELEPPGENKQITERERDCIFETTQSLEDCFVGQVRGPLLLLLTADQNFISILNLRTKD